MLAECAKSCFQLVEPGSVPQIQQAVNLWQVAVQPASQFRLADGTRAHGPIEREFGFGQRRKMLHKLLAPFGEVDGAFAAASVAPTARAEELAVEQWIMLANALAPGA